MANRSCYEIEIDKVPLDLFEGEVVCPKCEGTGHRWGFPCDRCWGFKKLDWIELITGKECPFEESGRSSSSSRSSTSTSKQTTQRRNLNGSNTKSELGGLYGLSEMFNKSKGSLQRRRYKIRRRKTEK